MTAASMCMYGAIDIFPGERAELTVTHISVNRHNLGECKPAGQSIDESLIFMK
ncbi:hypothetical protein [Citrobacter sp.]|uniref:hypothetical protein n=1 Tax=Citrobacter sp. TaxID=1896336 RepID=UPI003FA576DF